MDFTEEVYSSTQENDSSDYTYNYLYMLSTLFISTCVLIKLAESNNQIKYESFFARAIAGYLKFIVNTLHTKQGTLDLPIDKANILTIGPHRSGFVDGASVVAKLPKGISPPRFFATDSFNVIPGVASFMKMFHVITIAAKPDKSRTDGRSANEDALDEAVETIKQKGTFASFSQGNFAYIGADPHRVYGGAAKVAIRTNEPIHVLRLDGFWSIDNPYIPVFVKNHGLYRALLSALHPNDVKVTECMVIDFHLTSEAENMSSTEIVDELCAQQYAFYRHSQELSQEQIEDIRQEVVRGEHREVWARKMKWASIDKDIKEMQKKRDTARESSLEQEKKLFSTKDKTPSSLSKRTIDTYTISTLETTKLGGKPSAQSKNTSASIVSEPEQQKLTKITRSPHPAELNHSIAEELSGTDNTKSHEPSLTTLLIEDQLSKQDGCQKALSIIISEAVNKIVNKIEQEEAQAPSMQLAN